MSASVVVPVFERFDLAIRRDSHHLAAADLDADGHLDLVITHGREEAPGATVVFGRGDGQFDIGFDVVTDGAPQWPAIGDLDEDGRSDIVFPHYDAPKATILFGGAGSRSFTPVTIGLDELSKWIQIVDLDGDGLQDIVSDTRGGMNVRLGLGARTFADPQSVVPATSSWTNSSQVVDINGDGRPDIVRSGWDEGKVWVALAAEGGFAALTGYAVGSTPEIVTAADLNGDGFPDLAVNVSSPTDSLAILINQGDGSFAPSQTYSYADLGPNDYAIGGGVGKNAGIAVDDLNGDDALDVVVTNGGRGLVAVFVNAGDGTFLGPVGVPTGAGPWGLVAGDFNGDGRADLATSGYGGSLTVLLTVTDGETHTGTAAADTLVGTAGNDSLAALGGADRLSGDRGEDTLSGDKGRDTLSGEAGSDSISGGAGSDVLTGLGGDDTLDGGSGADTMSGGAGNDVYHVDDLADRVIEAAQQGIDTVVASRSHVLAAHVENAELVEAAAGNAALTGNELPNRLSGNSRHNVMAGGAGDDSLQGHGGNDVLRGDTGDDRLAGGDGADRLEGGDGEDSLGGGSGRDILLSGAADDSLAGHAANDSLDGADGNDILLGGTGRDELTGGAGADRFRFAEFGSADADVITDFDPNEDLIQIVALAFDPTLSPGAMPSGRFVARESGHGTAPIGQFVYETATGRLFWDINGPAQGRDLVASLVARPTIEAADFVLI